MHPAKSVIAFTTMSGAGYGLLVAAIIGELFGYYTASPTLFLVLHGIAFVLISGGLLSSTLHLGHPERAWRAMSQWRTSWLSREGLSAVVTYGPWALYVYAHVMMENVADIILLSGLVTAALAFFTIFTTSMIYRSIKAIPSWYNQYVTPIYLVFGLATGSTILGFILNITDQSSTVINQASVVTLVLALILKRVYWHSIDNADPQTTLETATGLGHLGKVKVLDQPHSHDNYLLQEMGYKVARKHSNKLRSFYTIMWLVAAACLAALLMQVGGALAFVCSVVAIAAMVLGVITERWLFFAEAKHVQALYYGH